MSYAEGDTDYGKDKEFMIPIEKAPFYGGAGNLGHGGNPSMVTLSGLVTDAEQNVLNTQWEKIGNLYAAGNCLGGRYGLGYSTPDGRQLSRYGNDPWLSGRAYLLKK